MNFSEAQRLGSEKMKELWAWVSASGASRLVGRRVHFAEWQFGWHLRTAGWR